MHEKSCISQRKWNKYIVPKRKQKWCIICFRKEFTLSCKLVRQLKYLVMLHSNTLECLLLNKCHGWKQYVLYVDIHNKYIVAIKFAKLIAASNHDGNKNFLKLFKNMYGSLNPRELLTNMSHYDKLTDGKIKGLKRYDDSWCHTRDTENTEYNISPLKTIYIQTLHFLWQTSRNCSNCKKVYSGIYEIHIYFHNYSLSNTLVLIEVWAFQVSLIY